MIAQGTEFPLRKPAGFHWDIFLLGLTTGVAGLLGIPFPNGLIPQAPFHTNALCVTRQMKDESESNEAKGHVSRVVDHVVEQRASNLFQGLLTLGTMTGPLLIVLHLIPQGVLAGLFFVMGVQALESNGITMKMLHIARDKSLIPATDPLKAIERREAVCYFVAIELIAFGATFAITQTIAAIGFPVFILVLIPIRTFLLPKYFKHEELALLDAPTASPFTMESVGGNHGQNTETLPFSSQSIPETRDMQDEGIDESTRITNDGTNSGNAIEMKDDREGLHPQRLESPTESGISRRSRSRRGR